VAKEITYNKLVRDNIHDIIRSQGNDCTVTTLNDDMYIFELKRKLVEECGELADAETREQVIEEFADVYEVCEALSLALNLTQTEIDNAREQKAARNGRFLQKLFLQTVIEK